MSSSQIAADIANSAARKYALPNCPYCNAPPNQQEIRNVNKVFRTGDVYCTVCGGRVRDWDPS